MRKFKKIKTSCPYCGESYINLSAHTEAKHSEDGKKLQKEMERVFIDETRRIIKLEERMNKYNLINEPRILELGKKLLSKNNDLTKRSNLEETKEGIKVSNNPLPKNKWRVDLCDSTHYD